MKFRILVKDNREKPWREYYDKLTSNPKQWSEDAIKYFNATLRGGERQRELLKVEVEGVDYRVNETEEMERG